MRNTPVFQPALASLSEALKPFDPVVTLLADLLKDPKARLTPATVAGLLGLMDSFSFNPNARILVPDSQDTLSALEAVLQLAHRVTPVATVHDWPTDLAALRLPLPGRPASLGSLDAQWLAATLLAAGANPWSSVTRANPLGNALPLAMRMHMAGLCARMWACTRGRPSMESLANARPPEVKKATRSWLDWATEEIEGAGVAGWLLSVGVRSPSGNHSLGWASAPDMVHTYHQASCLPVAPKEQKQVVLTWEKRLTKGLLSTSTLTALKQAFNEITRVTQPGQAPVPQDTQAHDLILQTLASSTWQGARTPINYRLTIDQLKSRTRVESGLHKGQWSLFAAVLMNPLRQPSPGIGRTDFSEILQVPSLKEKTWSVPATLDWAAHQGDLASAIDFDWRPGVSINGAVGIALLGYNDNALYEPGQRQQLCGLLGIKDFTTWWRANATAAAAFTKTLSAGSPSAFNRLRKIWSTIHTQDGDTFANSPQGALLLLQFLNRHFYLAGAGYGGVGHGSREHQKAVTGEVQGHDIPYCSYDLVEWVLDNAPAALDVDWQVELALLGNLDAPEWMDKLLRLANQGRMQKSHIARIKDYVDTTLKRVPALIKKNDTTNYGHTKVYLQEREELFERVLVPKFRQVVLSAKLPQATGTPERARL